MLQLRRSQRQQAAQYDANGRGYLAAEINYTIEQLEAWLASPTVQPHLRLWYNLCISGKYRYKHALNWIDAIDSIDCGESGYFYDEDGLQEDLLLECLGEGNVNAIEESEFGIEHVKTSEWSTQKLWARSAWRIVQDNCRQGQLFEEAVIKHPAAAYALAIDVLSIAYHSIVCRGSTSIWHAILNGPEISQASPLNVCNEVALDQKDKQAGEDEASQMDLDMDSDAGSEEEDDDDDSDFELEQPRTPKRSKKVYPVPTPDAPRKPGRTALQNVHTKNWLQSLSGSDSDLENIGSEVDQNVRTNNWLQSLPDSDSEFETIGSEDDQMSRLVIMWDDEGQIKGFQRAA